MNPEKIGQALTRIHILRIALLCIAANLLIYLFIVLPRQSNLVKLQDEDFDYKLRITNQQKELESLQKRLERLEQAKRDLSDIYDNLLVPKRTGVTEIRLEMEDLTRPLRVSRQNFTYDYGAKTQFGLQMFTLAVPIRGNYREIRQFINKIENSRHFLILENVALTTQKENDTLYLDFRISTYLTDKEGT